MGVLPDILVTIKFNPDKPQDTRVVTNAKPAVVEEILDDWVRAQMGAGSDPSKPANREVYTVKIGLRLEDDAFATESDTNNKGLTCGIVMAVAKLLHEPGNVKKMVQENK